MNQENKNQLIAGVMIMIAAVFWSSNVMSTNSMFKGNGVPATVAVSYHVR